MHRNKKNADLQKKSYLIYRDMLKYLQTVYILRIFIVRITSMLTYVVLSSPWEWFSKRELWKFCTIDTSCSYIYPYFSVAFFFNWIGFLFSICVFTTIAGRCGALSGLGLSIVKWVAIVKVTGSTTPISCGDGSGIFTNWVHCLYVKQQNLCFHEVKSQWLGNHQAIP